MPVVKGITKPLTMISALDLTYGSYFWKHNTILNFNAENKVNYPWHNKYRFTTSNKLERIRKIHYFCFELWESEEIVLKILKMKPDCRHFPKHSSRLRRTQARKKNRFKNAKKINFYLDNQTEGDSWWTGINIRSFQNNKIVIT